MHGHAHAQRQIHHLADLLGEHLAQRPAEHRKILREQADRPAIDRAVAGDHAIAERPALLHAEGAGAVNRKGIQFDKRAGIEQRINPLARSQLAARALALGCLWVGGARLLAAAAQLLDPFLGGFHSASITMYVIVCSFFALRGERTYKSKIRVLAYSPMLYRSRTISIIAYSRGCSVDNWHGSALAFVYYPRLSQYRLLPMSGNAAIGMLCRRVAHAAHVWYSREVHFSHHNRADCSPQSLGA